MSDRADQPRSRLQISADVIYHVDISLSAIVKYLDQNNISNAYGAFSTGSSAVFPCHAPTVISAPTVAPRLKQLTQSSLAVSGMQEDVSEVGVIGCGITSD